MDELSSEGFIALARSALDVMVRRKWGVRRVRGPGGVSLWEVVPYADGKVTHEQLSEMRFLAAFDPFVALVEAERWFAEHVDNVEVGE